MRRLIELGNSLDAAELVRRLNDASLTAIYTDAPAPGEGDVPISRSLVWISDDDDFTVATAVLEQFHAYLDARTGATCKGCRYDLRAHPDEGHCPECGRFFQRAPVADIAEVPEKDIPCGECGEMVPANFECCWNCGSVMS